MRKFPLILLIFLLLISFQNISAQKKSTKQDESKSTNEQFEPSVLVGGIINGSAINLKTPEYPKSCKCAGYIFVQVIFDATTNKVESTVAVSGHPLLRVASVKAVKESEFRIHAHFWRKNLKVLGFVVYRLGEVEAKDNDSLVDELKKLLVPYRKMDKIILPIAAYSLDQTMLPKLKNSPYIQNGNVEIKAKLSDKTPEVLQKIKQSDFEITENKEDFVIGKIAVEKLTSFAEIAEVLQISSVAKPKS